MTKRYDREREERQALSPAEFEVLLALADGDKHGYAILKETSRRGAGFGTATLYAILRRFVADGLLVESDDRPAAALDDDRRRYFRLTEEGRRAATAEAERLEEVLELARARKLVRRPRTV